MAKTVFEVPTNRAAGRAAGNRPATAPPMRLGERRQGAQRCVVLAGLRGERVGRAAAPGIGRADAEGPLGGARVAGLDADSGASSPFGWSPAFPGPSRRGACPGRSLPFGHCPPHKDRRLLPPTPAIVVAGATPANEPAVANKAAQLPCGCTEVGFPCDRSRLAGPGDGPSPAQASGSRGNPSARPSRASAGSLRTLRLAPVRPGPRTIPRARLPPRHRTSRGCAAPRTGRTRT